MRQWFEGHDLLDKWFVPIYGPEYELPRINGYKGTKRDDFTVEYGCATIKIDALRLLIEASASFGSRSIAMVKLSSCVELSLLQVKKIIEYFDNIKSA